MAVIVAKLTPQMHKQITHQYLETMHLLSRTRPKVPIFIRIPVNKTEAEVGLST